MESKTVKIEHTDTFGGEANYSWCNRYTMKFDKVVSNRTLVRRAKALCGFTGVKCRSERFWDLIALYPVNTCQVIFISTTY